LHYDGPSEVIAEDKVHLSKVLPVLEARIFWLAQNHSGFPQCGFGTPETICCSLGGFTNYYRVTDIHMLFSNNENSMAVIVVISDAHSSSTPAPRVVHRVGVRPARSGTKVLAA
jgi:hypothetical protein